MLAYFQMEIPVLSRISGFEAEIARLHLHQHQNPPFLSRVFRCSAIEEAIKVHTMWTLGALILALLAYFSSFITRLKSLIFRFSKGRSVISQPLLQQIFDDSDDDVDYDETCSDSSSSVGSSDGEDEYTWENDPRFDEDFRVAGSGNYVDAQGEFTFSWSDLINGKSIVNTWDEMCQIPALSMPSPSVIMSAGLETSRNMALRVFDTRVGRQIPQIFAEWQPRRDKFDSDNINVNSIVVRDLRKIASPVENLTESDVSRMWEWDSDAVIVDGNRELWGLGDGCGSVVSRCRNVVLSYLF